MRAPKTIIFVAALVASLIAIELSFAADWWNLAFKRRKQVTINIKNKDLATGDWIDFTFDHKGLVDEGKAIPAGQDARIVYWNGASSKELYRILDEKSSWNSPSTKVWFRAEAAIPAGLSDTGYYLYYDWPKADTPQAVPELEAAFKGWKAGEAAKEEEARRVIEEEERKLREAEEQARLMEELRRQQELLKRRIIEKKNELNKTQIEVADSVFKLKGVQGLRNMVLALTVLAVLVFLVMTGRTLFQPKPARHIAPPGFRAKDLAARLTMSRPAKKERKDLFARR